MSAEQHRIFQKRISRIERAHRRSLERRARIRILGRLFVTGPIVILALGIATKSLILANVAAQTYAETLQSFSTGGRVQQVLAFMMRPDPVTSELARYARLPR